MHLDVVKTHAKSLVSIVNDIRCLFNNYFSSPPSRNSKISFPPVLQFQENIGKTLIFIACPLLMYVFAVVRLSGSARCG